jgi:ribosomal protein L27
MASLYTELEPGEKTVSIEGAKWLQVRFAGFQLGAYGLLTITDAAGQSQTFTQKQLEEWEGLSAVFNGSKLTITLTPGESSPGETEKVAAAIKEIVIGLPGQAGRGVERVAPQPLRNLLGRDPDRFIPADVPRQPEGAPQEAICGSTDDRTASGDLRAGRIVPIGCTAWLIQGGALLTAGHCIGASTEIVEFNVRPSQADGTTVASLVRDQYRVITSSIVSTSSGVGNDWAVFRVQANTQTGLMPIQAQGASFQLSTTANPGTVRITGFGVDGPAPNFGAGGARNADNQTQQTHLGTLTSHTVGGANSATLRYTVDTQGGNSGSPVFDAAGGNVAIGIHTNGGCSAAGGSNAGTSLRHQGLWAATGVGTGTDDIVWQHRTGQVHYWPMLNGQRQNGINVHVPVGPEWTLAGVGDLNGDGTDDLVWQHRMGQVHYWQMQNGQRMNGINVHVPVDGNWRIAGVGNVD